MVVELQAGERSIAFCPGKRNFRRLIVPTGTATGNARAHALNARAERSPLSAMHEMWRFLSRLNDMCAIGQHARSAHGIHRRLSQ